ncbi:hypothetical protein [Endozoicomonas euniceicola]|uniref:Uncharacterized protein n=1 Tax=Endozoicomonas euniceicola TaxID=1234143 RepID=A0ABY6GTQ4_9GAMM|nr:hypothetical protein [Endozoicomonas euniceicola]UYM15947.1 hypothetical protein NX720_24540 [Endozoicomonas euniceicola]
MLNRRSFLLSTTAAIGILPFASKSIASSVKNSPELIKLELKEDFKGTFSRLEKAANRNNHLAYVDDKNRIPVTYRVKVVDYATMRPLVGAKVYFLLSDAFTSDDKVPGIYNRNNADIELVRNNDDLVFKSHIPADTIKGNQLLNPADVIVKYNGLYSIARINLSGSQTQLIKSMERRLEKTIKTKTLSDIAFAQHQREGFIKDVNPVSYGQKYEAQLTLLMSSKIS